MSEAEVGQKPVYLTPMEEIKKPRVMPWHWVAFYAWNLWRKPLVWKRQRMLKEYSMQIIGLLKQDVLPNLWDNKDSCPTCRDAYMMLKPQIFVSQIKLILKNMKCENHHELFDRFMEMRSYDFEMVEKLSAWINGFGKI